MSEFKQRVKNLADNLPFSGDLEWRLVGRSRMQENERFRQFLENVQTWADDARSVPVKSGESKKVLLFAMIHLWVRYAAALSLLLNRLGHNVTLAYLPYQNWFDESPPREDTRLHYYYQACLQPLAPLISLRTLYSRQQKPAPVPEELAARIEMISERDFQYSRQVEEVDQDDPLFMLRRKRNRYAAGEFYQLLQADRPDVVIVPNGMILEFGVLYEVARYLEIPAVTYEFGEQKDKIWISQDQPVMFQNTDELWDKYKDQPFTEGQQNQIEELYASRKNASLWKQFSRQWQEVPSEGEREVKARLGLDERPIVLMAVNVIGDSLTLGRQVYSVDMSEWISRTLAYFREKPEVQFILRIHPGERYTDGPSVEDIIRQRFLDVPDHFRVISASDKINTYDLVTIADLGLTYTTTVGMEMAMSGLPVIVSGNTHYRGKGFTLDPASWEQYFEIIEAVLASPGAYQYTAEKLNTVWHYAYCFFFEYPFPSPWHLRGILEMIQEQPISRLVSEESLQQYGSTYSFLLNQTVAKKEN
ncbi:MAG: hypothetical protein JW757_05445 [Anaerolineales bacterium]|nr:hypothetical protein [Anaerolineales bacterium]